MKKNYPYGSMVKPPVILLGGGFITISIGRTLARSGIKTYALDEPNSEAHHSRFVQGVCIRTDAVIEDVWLEWLLKYGIQIHDHPLLIPCSDEGLVFIVKYRNLLQKHFNVIEANDDIILSMLDKAKTYKLTEKYGIPAPKVWSVENIDELEKILPSIQYPCALKPRESHEFAYRFPGIKLFEVYSKDDMIKRFHQTEVYKLKMLITELISADDEGYHSYYTYLDENGEPLFNFTKRRIRQYPNLWGLGTYNISNWNPEVAELGLRFFQSIKLRGIGTVEFIRDRNDGILKLIECNPRFTGTTELLDLCGLNWPLLVYNRMNKIALPAVNDYKYNVRIIRLSSDFLAFRELRRNGKITFFRWLGSILHYQHFFYFRWNDLSPFFNKIFTFIIRQLIKMNKSVPNQNNRQNFVHHSFSTNND